LDAHRDDHYLFFLIEKGKSQAMVDFHQFALNGNDLFFILPGQIHRYIYASKEITGWFLAIDAGLIPDEFRACWRTPCCLSGQSALKLSAWNKWGDVLDWRMILTGNLLPVIPSGQSIRC
jgi:hypothetical protein